MNKPHHIAIYPGRELQDRIELLQAALKEIDMSLSEELRPELTRLLVKYDGLITAWLTWKSKPKPQGRPKKGEVDKFVWTPEKKVTPTANDSGRREVPRSKGW